MQEHKNDLPDYSANRLRHGEDPLGPCHGGGTFRTWSGNIRHAVFRLYRRDEYSYL